MRGIITTQFSYLKCVFRDHDFLLVVEIWELWSVGQLSGAGRWLEQSLTPCIVGAIITL